MSNIPNILERAFDSDGDPISGAKLYFYEAGTTTPLDTYSDEALSSPNTNPVVADADGYYGEIYFEKLPYKVKFTDASDVQIWEEDDINPVSLNTDDVMDRLLEVASNPIYYGAVGDGVADESSEVQSAIDNASGTVDLLGKIYRCDSALTLDDGITFKNGTIDFSACDADEMLKTVGTRGSGVALTGDASRGDIAIDVASVSGLVAGDWLYLTSDAKWSGDDVGEIVQILSIAALEISLTRALDCAYATGDNAAIQKLTMKTNVTIENVNITANNATSGAGRVVYAELCDRFICRNVRVNGIKASGFELRHCVDSLLEKCLAENDNGGGSGFDIAAASVNIRVIDCDTYDIGNVSVYVGRTDTHDGVARDIWIERLNSNGADTGVSIDNAAERVAVLFSTIVGLGSSSSYGINSSGTNCVFSFNTLRECGSYGIDAGEGNTYTGNQPWSLACDFNTIDSVAYGIRIDDDMDGVSISGNKIVDCTNDGIRISDGDRYNVDGNLIYSPGSRGIYVTSEITESVFTNNVIIATTAISGIYLEGNKLTVSNNIMRSGDTNGNGIYVETVDGAEGIVITENSSDGFQVPLKINAAGSSLSGLAISGNVLLGSNGASKYSAHVYGTIDGVQIVGNTMKRDDDSDANLYLEGATADAIDNVSVSGNNIDNGTYCITESNCDTIKLQGNNLTGYATGETSGTFVSLDDTYTEVKEMRIRNWREIALGTTGEDYKGIKYGNGYWVIVGDDGTDGAIRYSKDGFNWNTAVVPGSSGKLHAVTFDSSNAIWVAVGEAGEILFTADVTTWGAGTAAGAFAGVFYDVSTDNNGLFCAVGTGGMIQTSTDGNAWVVRTPDASYSGTFLGVEHDQSSLWMAVGANEEIQTSADAITWSEKKTFVSAFDYYGLDYSSLLDLWIVVGGSGAANKIYSSPNGTDWTEQSAPAGTPDIYIYDVAWDAVLRAFVAVGGGAAPERNAVTYSFNGEDWDVGDLSEANTASTHIASNGDGRMMASSGNDSVSVNLDA